jgi:hypothetical protein
MFPLLLAVTASSDRFTSPTSFQITGFVIGMVGLFAVAVIAVLCRGFFCGKGPDLDQEIRVIREPVTKYPRNPAAVFPTMAAQAIRMGITQ